MAKTLADYLALFTERLLQMTARSIEDLNDEQVHFRAHADMNSVGFEAWHIARTADNLIHFAFERQQPVWLQQGLDTAWNLPKADQGTGMSPDDAYALRFPTGELLAKYARDVAGAVVPRIAAMSDGYLATTTTIRPQGELPRAEIIGQVIVAHGHDHIGQINLARTLQGKAGLGF